MQSVAEELSKIITKQQGEDLIRSMKISKERISKGYLEDFKRAFLSTKFVNLTLAFSPDLGFLEELKKWFSQNLGYQVILDLKVDPEVVAGVIVICNNHYVDFSLGTFVEEIASNGEVFV